MKGEDFSVDWIFSTSTKVYHSKGDSEALFNSHENFFKNCMKYREKIIFKINVFSLRLNHDSHYKLQESSFWCQNVCVFKTKIRLNFGLSNFKISGSKMQKMRTKKIKTF